jgi:hypothetical protein
LIHIFEDEWFEFKDVIKSKLKILLNKTSDIIKVHGRKCQIKEISQKEFDGFCRQYHLQKTTISKFKYGAFYENTLVSVIGLNKKSISKGKHHLNDDSIELTRFCVKSNFIVHGIFNKFINFFKRNTEYKKIITYMDLRWSDSNKNIYLTSNFNFSKKTPPNYWYMKNYKNRLHRYNFTKHRLVKMGCDSTKTEWEIMQELGYDRIWDCGHLKYELNLN